MNIYLSIISISLIITFSGCSNLARSFGVDTTNNKAQDIAFAKGDYNISAILAYQNIDQEKELDTDNLLPALKAGNSFLFAKEYKRSQDVLNSAEDIIKYQHQEIKLQTSSQYLSQLMLNDASVEYKASITDSIMLNTYKAISYMEDGDFEATRVEFNRAIDRQRRAKDVYAELISKQEDAIEQERRKGTKLNTSVIDSIASSRYSNLQNFKAYPDFINPFTTYIAGLYFALRGDYTKSIDLLKEAGGMEPNNKVVAQDFEMVDDILSAKRSKPNNVWLVFENGFAPIKQETKLSIPVFVVSNKVSYVGIALPVLKTRYGAYQSINLSSKDASADTQMIASMDRVIKTEFRYGYKYIITRALLSATLKAVAQYQASRTSGGEYASLAVGIFSAMTTHADTRSWTTLPKDFQISKIDMPKDKKLSITYGLKHYNLKLDDDVQNAIVYVRIPTSTSKPSISVINFKD